MKKWKWPRTKYLHYVIAACLLGLYMVAAYEYIYFRIGAAQVPASDTSYIYQFVPTGGQYQPLVYAAIGDSLTAGVGVPTYEQSYPYALAEKLSRDRGSVILRDFSYPGARTSDVIKDLLEPAVGSDPDIVTILIGTNDIHGRVNPDTFAKNYNYILDQLRDRTQAKTYLVSIPYIGSDSLLLPPYGFYFRRRVDQYNRIIRRIATERGLPYIDLTTPTASESHYNAYYAADLFHPKADGYAEWATLMYDGINR